MLRMWVAACGTMLLVQALACSTPVAPPPEEAESNVKTYVIGAADTLSIRVWKNPELSVDAPVRPDGMISVPLLDDVPAAGLTAEDLKEVITRELAEYVAAPDVTVTITGMGSKRAFVVGAVARNGPISVAVDTRVTDAIASAGGFTTFANKRNVKVIRRVEGGAENEYVFNYTAYIAGNAPGTNFVLRPGDTVVVPE